MIYYSPHRKAHRRWRFAPRMCRTTIAIQILLVVTVSLIVCGFLEMSNMGISLLSSNPEQQLVGGQTEPQSHLEEGEEHAPAGDGTPLETEKFGFRYKTVTGYFAQDDPFTDPGSFHFTRSNFGLITREYDSDGTLPNSGRHMTPWQRFEHHLSTLNRRAREEEADGDEDKRMTKRHGSHSSTQMRYILFFLGRHGNGYHNIAERYYGGVAWDCHFSALDGDASVPITWSDAHLSKEGKRQAHEINAFWRRQISEDGQKMSLPERYLVSPLDRTLETLEISFEGLLPHDGEGSVVVVEKLREGTGIHTCDRRSSVSYIRDHFPHYNVAIDPNLTENDGYWDADRREPDSVLVARQRSMFDSLVADDKILGSDAERVSITSHSGAIAAMLRALGHREFALGTGGVIPVLVQVERIALTDGVDNDKKLAKRTLDSRHGGSGESAGGKDPVLDLPDLDSHQEDQSDPAQSDAIDRSKWQPIPSCPADIDLDTIGQKRWGMTLKEFLDSVENGTLDPHALPSESTG